jgi:DNA helicase-2/ATP-dependent DNA helicase PcrA
MGLRRIIGPPGTGKTAFIARQVERWVERGVDPARILLVSHTRAAARVIAERVDVPAENVGTLHSMGYRAIGRPAVAEVGKLASAWNQAVDVPGWRIASVDDVDPYGVPGGRSHFERMMLARARGEQMPWELVQLAQLWDQFKLENDAVDFADMLELPVRHNAPPPGAPTHIVVDEAQDLTPAGWALVHHWARYVGELVVAGDPAQTIYEWAGARPDDLLADGWDERMLSRSWRLAPAIHEYAERFLTRHSGKLGDGRWYRPREGTDGVVDTVAVDLQRSADAVAELVEREMATGTVMVLAQAAYMLRPVCAALLKRGVVFHNPYRVANGAWNPLREDVGEGRTSTVARVKAFLRPDYRVWGDQSRLWATDDLVPWLRMLRTDAFRTRGAREALLAEPGPGLLDAAFDAFTPEARVGAESLDLDWLAGAVLAEYRPVVERIAAIAALRGTGFLAEPPRVVVGTIHSVKGGEADVVILAPDVSPSAAREMVTTEGMDAMVRLFYVGITRARDKVLWCTPSTRLAI